MEGWLRVSALAAVAATVLAFAEAFLVARSAADLRPAAVSVEILGSLLPRFCAWCQMKDQNEAQLSDVQI